MRKKKYSSLVNFITDTTRRLYNFDVQRKQRQPSEPKLNLDTEPNYRRNRKQGPYYVLPLWLSDFHLP